MWQIQFDVEGDNRFETYLNIQPFVEKEKEVRWQVYSKSYTKYMNVHSS